MTEAHVYVFEKYNTVVQSVVCILKKVGWVEWNSF